MAIVRVQIKQDDWTIGQGMSGISPFTASHYICDTEAERATVGAVGDTSLAKDTGVHAIRDASGWVKAATLDGTGKVPTAQLPAGQSSIPFREFTIAGAGFVWTNMPAALTELGGVDFRIKADLTGFTEVRFVSRIAGGTFLAGMTMKVQYSTNESAWSDLTPTVATDSAGTKVSAWTAIPAPAQADVFLRVVGAGGNGAQDPRVGTQLIQVK